MDLSNLLLRRYRSDRRKLIEFMLSSGLIKEVATPAGPSTSISNIDFDSLSSDYVLECARSGGVLNVSQATKRYINESSLPIAMHRQSGDTFYLHSDPESAGSPPRRAPPPVPSKKIDSKESCDSKTRYYAATKGSPLSSKEARINSQVTRVPGVNYLRNDNALSLGLPSLKTGLLDDDLRESAYEVLLSCMLFSRAEVHSFESRKRGKSSKFLTALRSKREKRRVESESPESPLKVLGTIRTQMQISETVDTFIRRRLMQFAAEKSVEQIDVPQVSLALLTGVLRSDFPSEKQYLHWTNRQANVLEELLSSDHQRSEKQVLVFSLAKIRNPQEWDIKMSPSERNDVLLTIRRISLALSSIPGRFSMDGETYYWTSGYRLNIRLYEKLLFALFDILEDGQLIEEADEILKLLKLTWPMLGITERLHHALFAWVFFQQFTATEEAELFEYAIREVEKVLSAEVYDNREDAYISSLMCSSIGDGVEIGSNVLRSIFLSISLWCDTKLQDYHQYFTKDLSFFKSVVTMGLRTATQNFVSPGNIQFVGSPLPDEVITEKIITYAEKSLDAACKRITGRIAVGSIKDNVHPLADLACELRLIAEKDFSFSQVLRNWYPECAMVAAKRLHHFYGERLRPFLEDRTCHSEDAGKVLPAAYALERCLTELYSTSCKENKLHSGQEFDYYPIAEVSRSIILDWVVAQQERILEWTQRAFDIEDWEPSSFQQKQAASVVEVFRIIEETVDQFFEWSLPKDITHLQALLSIIFHSLDTYLSKMVNQLVEKHNLYPSTSPLTRYKEATFPVFKKKEAQSLIIDDVLYKQLDDLTVTKLCIRLNTYQYIQKQTTLLEDEIRKSWKSVTSDQLCKFSMMNPPNSPDSTDLNGESVSELFVATLDCIRDSAGHATRKTSEFLGAKIVFWDMRDSYLLHLYYGGVEGNRLDNVLPQFDAVLNTVCGLIDDRIRDLVVSSIWKAALEGFMWVLLDGGPSRAFADTDIPMIEEDFDMLRDLFVADGEGLPRSVVESEAKFYRQILGLFSLETESLIRMLIASSNNISASLSSYKHHQLYLGDAHTLIRILCHKKDREASKFLKMHYQLPPSSEYDDLMNPGSPLVANMLRSASLRWSDKGHSSFRSLKKRLQEARGNKK